MSSGWRSPGAGLLGQAGGVTLEALAATECLELLATEEVGRLGILQAVVLLGQLLEGFDEPLVELREVLRDLLVVGVCKDGKRKCQGERRRDSLCCRTIEARSQVHRRFNLTLER